MKTFASAIALSGAITLQAADFHLAAKATNELALDLHRQLIKTEDNLCVSPYSIQAALIMIFAGADGMTRTEMARVLHFPNDGDKIHASFSQLQRALDKIAKNTATDAERSTKTGGKSESVTLTVANRLFSQDGYEFRRAFHEFVAKNYATPLAPLDFKKDPGGATKQINDWAAKQTRDRIRDLIPLGALNEMTRLVLANAIYLKAPWAHEFNERLTTLRPFYTPDTPIFSAELNGGITAWDDPPKVPTMHESNGYFGFAKRNGFTALALPYIGGEVQLLVLMPNDVDGLRTFESKLTADTLAQCARLEKHEINLYLPKFKFEPPTVLLGEKLQALGMKSAFDQPHGSANFERIAPRKPNDYLYVSQVFHKTFIAVDERGTEAAASTALAITVYSAHMKEKKPIEVKIDRPFVYAIQHVPSGACLFLGRVTDPR